MPPLAGLLWARVYAMSKHNQGMRWVLGALGLLLYMGSLGTGVVRTLPFSHSSLPLPYPQNMVSQFFVIEDSCNRSAQDRVLAL
jgi:hypothetical protein